MASPFTSAERIKILQIAGIPPGTKTVNVNALVLYPFSNVDAWQTNFFSTGDLSPILTALDNNLNNHTDVDTGNAVRECFAAWDVFKFSEIELTTGPTGSGGPAVVSAAGKRHAIRNYVANLLGFYIPEGGYIHEMEVTLGKSLKEFRKTGR
jgi:hypothetical protein